VKKFAWSFSALTRFENCPKQYWHLNVAKDFKDADSSFSEDGKFIHDALYKRVIKKVPLPMELRPLEQVAAKFASTPGEKKGEMKLALNRDMEPVDFFAHDVWVRAVVDLLIVKGNKAVIVDWKTGKPKEDFTQLGLTAAVVAQWVPEVDSFMTAYVWTSHRKVSFKAYTKDDLASVWNDMLPRSKKVEHAISLTEFPAKSSGLCGYCPVSSCPHFNPR